jgi:hypothetical protein
MRATVVDLTPRSASVVREPTLLTGRALVATSTFWIM